MDFLQLRYFCEIARDQNMRKTADRLLISQPALSKSLRNLETELGVKLFDRTGRGIKLNSTGSYFYREVAAALSGLDHAVTVLPNLYHSEHRTVKIANLVPEHITWLLEAFLEENPTIPLHEVMPDRPLDEAFRAGQIDLALAFEPLASVHYESIELLRDTLLLLVPPDHRFADRESIGVEEVSCEPFITYNSGLGIPDSVLRHLEYPVYQVSDLMMIIRLIDTGYGLSILPSYLWMEMQPKVQFLRNRGRMLSAIPLQDSQVQHTLYLIYPRSHELTGSVARCAEFFTDYFRLQANRLTQFREGGYQDPLGLRPPRDGNENLRPDLDTESSLLK